MVGCRLSNEMKHKCPNYKDHVIPWYPKTELGSPESVFLAKITQPERTLKACMSLD